MSLSLPVKSPRLPSHHLFPRAAIPGKVKVSAGARQGAEEEEESRKRRLLLLTDCALVSRVRRVSVRLSRRQPPR